MYTEDPTQVYIDSLSPSLPCFLEELRQYAADNSVPVIRRRSEPLLRFLLAAHRPRRILEIGTAIGYSSIFMCYAVGSVWGGKDNNDPGPLPCCDDLPLPPKDFSIDTIERSKDWSGLARHNIKAVGYEDHINLIYADADDILPGLQGPYDMVFMDAAKGQYLNFLPHVTGLLRPGGILISDNTLMDGDIIKPRSLIHRRDRTIHSRMRAYLYELTHSEVYETLVLPLADGTAVSVKKF